MRLSPKLWFGVVALMFPACATVGPPQPPSLELPKPPADLRASRKGDKVLLTWTIPATTTDRQTIRNLGPTQICRDFAPEMARCVVVAKTAAQPATSTESNSKQKPTSSFSDTLPSQLLSDAPSASVTYAVEVLNRDGRTAGLSNQVRVSLLRALPPPTNFKALVEREGVVLSWAAEPPPVITGVRYVYRVYRSKQSEQQSILVGEIPAGNSQTFSLTDSEIEWQKTYDYWAEAVAVFDKPNQPQLEGEDTPVVSIFADDVFPPAVPSGLQAVFSGPGQNLFIDLIWAPVTDSDLAGYNIYRHEDGSPSAKLNTELAKAPAYRDAAVQPGKRYFYVVTAVDIHGNESAHSDETSEAVP